MKSLFTILALVLSLVAGSVLAAQGQNPLVAPTQKAATFPNVAGPIASGPGQVQDLPPTVNSQGMVSRPPGASPMPLNFGTSNLSIAGTSGFRRMTKAERELNQKVRKFLAEVKQADDSQAEAAATKNLRETLVKLFDERMKHREKEIESLKKRLQELQSKNNARKNKRDEIVDLKLKSMVNEAKGFGF